MNATSYVIPLPPQPSLPVVGETGSYPVRRIWCVGRNYLEHIREMGNDEREPPFFFAKPADAIVPDGGTVPYPPLTSDLHHASRNIKRPWEIGKAFDGSAPCGPLRPASEIGHPAKGRIHLKVNGEV